MRKHDDTVRRIYVLIMRSIIITPINMNVILIILVEIWLKA